MWVSWKKKWLGDNYHKASLVEANDVEFSNVGPVRPAFREDQLQRELNYIVTHGNLVAPLVGKEDGALDNAIELSNRNVICGAQPYLDKLGGAYESYRDKQTAEIKQITLQMKDL